MQKAYCKHCGKELPVNHIGPCPYCGKEGKIVHVTLTDVVKLSDSIDVKKKKNYLKISYSKFIEFTDIIGKFLVIYEIIKHFILNISIKFILTRFKSKLSKEVY